MKEGEFLIARKSIDILVWDFSTNQKLYTLELKKGQKYQIHQVLPYYPYYSVEVKYKQHNIGFSLIDIDGQKYEFYRKYFYNHRTSHNKLRKIKLKQINQNGKICTN